MFRLIITNMENFYNPLLCLSIKSKGLNIQCPHIRKSNSDYCGIHLKCKKITRIDSILKINPTIEKHKYVTKIQKTFRGWNIRRRNKSNNKEDCATLDNILSIPIEYYFDYLDDDGFTYAFDLRTLDLISINPYNLKPFPKSNAYIRKFNSKMQYIKKTERKMRHDSPKLTEDQKYNQFLVRVFQKFDMIGQYTDTNWFENLSLEELKKFYKSAYDMFDYRSQLPMEIRKKITKNGLMFFSLISEINFFKQKHKKQLQLEILKEMERIIDEGEDKEYKTLGMNLILSALVEVSHSAAIALPHLVQSTFI